jgi:hypothetical protein
LYRERGIVSHVDHTLDAVRRQDLDRLFDASRRVLYREYNWPRPFHDGRPVLMASMR